MKQNLKLNAEISIDLSLIAHSDDGIVITDSKGVILWVNPSFERISEFSLSEAVGKSLLFLCGTFTDREVIERIHQSFTEGRSFSGDVLNYRRSGESFWISLNLTPVRNDTDITHFIGVMRDITARKDVERQIVRLQAQLSSMKYLEGWIVQCAWDKTVKDKKGNFINLETFIERYTDARFTHGISPNAREREKKKKKS
ncbi:MAG: PAS domain S-box protein [Chloroherpetonaceae bacterium]